MRQTKITQLVRVHTHKNICALELLLVNIGSETQTNTKFLSILVQFEVNLAQKTMKKLGKCIPPIAMLVLTTRFLLNYF